MERHLTLKPLSIQDENSVIHRKKAIIDGKSKSTKPNLNKGGAAVEGRKALNDITNKSSIRLEALSRKSSQDKKSNVVESKDLPHHASEAQVPLKVKSSKGDEINIAEEGFLHDHRKCIETQKAATELNFWDIVLPGHDSAEMSTDHAESDPDIRSTCSIDELDELSMSEFSDWSESWWKSPPSSPIRWPSPPLSPFSWELEPVELLLKEDEDHCDI